MKIATNATFIDVNGDPHVSFEVDGYTYVETLHDFELMEISEMEWPIEHMAYKWADTMFGTKPVHDYDGGIEYVHHYDGRLYLVDEREDNTIEFTLDTFNTYFEARLEIWAERNPQ